jgi:hypothetical protein
MKVAITQLWNKTQHGGDDDSKANGHYLNILILDIDDFLEMSNDEIPSYTKFNLINEYNLDNYSLGEIHTYKINIIKRKWKKYLNWKKKLKVLEYRRL